MDILKNFLDSVFAAYPESEEVARARNDKKLMPNR